MITRMLLLTVCLLGVPRGVDAQRRPLSIAPLTGLEHQPTGSRFRLQRDGGLERYSVDGRIEYLPEAGAFRLSWLSQEGERINLTWIPRDKIAAVTAVEVAFDSITQMYTYEYSFENLSESRQDLHTIYLEAANVNRAAAPDSTWYSRGLSSFLQQQLGTKSGWAWSQTEGAHGIPAGQMRSGFQITSMSPPGVVQIHVAGWVPPLRAGEAPPDALHEAIDRAAFRLPNGLTVGPVPLNRQQSPVLRSIELFRLADEAGRQGWLGSAPFADSTRASVSRIRSFLAEGNEQAAIAEIGTLVARVNADQSADLLSEGRAILEFRLVELHHRLLEIR